VRGCAAGLRYVLYAFLCDLNDPSRVIAAPGGHLLAPVAEKRVGDVSNVLFTNGLVMDGDGRVFLYYASSDTRLHVATADIDTLLDYVLNNPADALRSAACVAQRTELIRRNLAWCEAAASTPARRRAGAAEARGSLSRGHGGAEGFLFARLRLAAKPL